MDIDKMIDKKMVYIMAFYEAWIVFHIITIIIGWTGPLTNSIAFGVAIGAVIAVGIVRRFKKDWDNTLLIMFVKKFNEYLDK